MHDNGSKVAGKDEQNKKLAFFGIHACDLHALQIQDKVFMAGEYRDPHYKNVRDRLFIVAVNCIEAGGTCFCASMGTGPRASSGFDLALTEIIRGKEHYFIVETGSNKGTEVLKEVPHKASNNADAQEIERTMEAVSKKMGRQLETKGLKEALQEKFDHPRWDVVAKRCLACANCTMVCPTCFCSTVDDLTDLSGAQANRVKRWDSCFTLDFTYIHGGSIRPSTKARYRQWLSHKLANWIDQFGTSGCVGCGRCITWCPVGIDITEEAGVIVREPVQKTTTS
jgi:ferredoxin